MYEQNDVDMKKKILLFAFFMACVAAAFAQQSGANLSLDPVAKRNELSINLFSTIFASTPEISYERMLNEDMSVGGRFMASLDKERYAGVNVALTPTFRWYFMGNSVSTTRYASGLFAEVNASVGDYLDEFHAGLGMGTGYKYVNKSGWSFQLGIYGTRFLGEGYGMTGFFQMSVGKRF